MRDGLISILWRELPDKGEPSYGAGFVFQVQWKLTGQAKESE